MATTEWVGICEGCACRIVIFADSEEDRALEWSGRCVYCDNGNDVLFVSRIRAVAPAAAQPDTERLRKLSADWRQRSGPPPDYIEVGQIPACCREEIIGCADELDEEIAEMEAATAPCKTCRGSGFVAYSTHAGGAEGEGCPDCAPSDPPRLQPPAAVVQPAKSLVDAAQWALNFLDTCEWNSDSSANDAEDIRVALEEALTVSAPAAVVSPTQRTREYFLRLAREVSDIARGNDGAVDPDHDVNTCEVCGRVADLIQSSVVSPREEPKKENQ